MTSGRKKVLILGGASYSIKAIQAVRDNGYDAIVADRNPRAAAAPYADTFLPIDISDRKAILYASVHHRADAIVPLNDYGVPVAAYVASQLGLPGISEEAAEISCNKELMRKRWSEQGVPCPKFRIAVTREKCREVIEDVGIPCILKPAHGVGGGSRGVVVVREPAEIEPAITLSQSYYSDKTTLVETFIACELEHSAEVLICGEEMHVLSVSDKIKSPLPYRVDKNVLYPTALGPDRRRQLEEVIKTSVRTLGITLGSAHVEIATTADGFILFELGARCGGGGTPDPIIPWVTGVNQMVEVIRLHLGEKPCIDRRARERGANYHFIFPREGILKKVYGLEQVQKLEGVLDAQIVVAPGQVLTTVKSHVDRAGFIIAAGQTQQEAYEIGTAAEKRIELVYQ